MKALLVVALLAALAPTARAWDTSKNPDQLPSIGWGLHGGKLAGLASDYNKYTEFSADVRVPVTNYLSLTVDYAQTNVGSVPMGTPTSVNRLGAQVRVFLADLK